LPAMDTKFMVISWWNHGDLVGRWWDLLWYYIVI
jgi:hypothetical protein